MSSLQRLAGHAREWLFDAALPFWATHGVDRRFGGFHDLVGPDGSPVSAPKRSFVQARQVFSFVEAGALGWPGEWRGLVEIGLDVLDTKCRSEAGGFVHRLREDLTVDEPRRDLYDQAFIAFATARAGSALGRREVAAEADRIFGELDRHWSSEDVGFWEGELLAQPPRRQNPHMHLVEAAWAAASTPWAGPDDRRRLDRFTGFIDTFADSTRGLLPELFDETWRALPDGVTWVEPGHHFEWFWLLERVRAAGGGDWTALGSRLWRFGLEHGIDAERNVAIDELNPDGSVRSAMARLWPQTERLKGAIADFRLSGASSFREIEAAYAGLQPYLAAPAAGAFFDKLRPDGTFVHEPARASSLYHIICAYGEWIRLAVEIG